MTELETLRAQLSEKEAEIARLKGVVDRWAKHFSEWAARFATVNGALHSELTKAIGAQAADAFVQAIDHDKPIPPDPRDAQLAALRVERDEAVANLDAIKAKTRPMLDECIRNSEIAQQTVDAARAEVARIQAQWGADYERLTKAELLSAAERVTRRAAEARAEGAIAAQAKAEQERDEARMQHLATAGPMGRLAESILRERARADAAEAARDAARAEAEGLREALTNALQALRIALANLTEPGAQPRPAERCKVLIPAMDGRPFAVNECGAPLPCAEHTTSREGK